MGGNLNKEEKDGSLLASLFLLLLFLGRQEGEAVSVHREAGVHSVTDYVHGKHFPLGMSMHRVASLV